MGDVDRESFPAAAARCRRIADELRVVCEENGHCRLQDGTAVRFRLIDPTDASACCTMLGMCTPKSLYARYEQIVHGPLEELAQRLCSPDLDSELNVVAETLVDGSPAVVGIAQLLTDLQRSTAEYALLVADPWQSKGLGSAFTDCCLRLAEAWGICRVVAEFLPENTRIIRILEKRSFDMYRDVRERVVCGQKRIRLENAEGRAGVPSPPRPDAS